MKRILTFIFLIHCFSSHAQNIDSIANKYESSIKTEDLKRHLKVLTSKELSGRETGTEGNRLAADYLQRQFTDMGIPPLPNGRYFQTFPLINQKSEGIHLYIDGDSLSWIKDFYSTRDLFVNREIKGKLIFITQLTDSQEVEQPYKGLIPVLYRPEKDKETKERVSIDDLKEKGAAAVFVILDDFDVKAEKAGKWLSHDILKLAEEGVYEDVPVLYISPVVGEKILSMKPEKFLKNSRKKQLTSSLINKEGKVEIKRETNIISSQNVLAYIEGNDLKDELIIVTAHYDHLGEKDGEIYYGADDDGSGTSALLELAEAFIKASKEGVKFKRSILFMPVSGEEKGLLGSRYYTNNPVFPLKNTITDLNIDMIGRHDANHEAGSSYIYLIGSDKLSTELHQISEETNDACCQLELDYTFNDDKDPNRYYYRSDHYNFAKKNIPVIFYFSGVHEDYHKPTDTMDKIDLEMLRKRTILIYHTAWNLLMAESRPKVNK